MTAPSRTRGSHRLTAWDTFVALPDTDRRELIDGDLIETEMPTKLHEHIVAHLVFYFCAWVRQHGGSAYASGYRVRVDSRHGFFPDAQLYHPNNTAQQTDNGCERGGPDIAVEVLSEGSAQYDRKTKLLGYARIGVAEYWLFSQHERAVERLVLRRGKYVVEEVLTPGDTLTSRRFAGLVIPVSELFTVPPTRR